MERNKLVKRLDMVFSKYIRLRDSCSNGTTRCISCGVVMPSTMMDCGHFFTRHNMSTRWDEDNCHAQCIRCNRFLSGNMKDYEDKLIKKIGQERFDELRVRAHQTAKYTKADLENIYAEYVFKLNELKKYQNATVITKKNSNFGPWIKTK